MFSLSMVSLLHRTPWNAETPASGRCARGAWASLMSRVQGESAASFIMPRKTHTFLRLGRSRKMSRSAHCEYECQSQQTISNPAALAQWHILRVLCAVRTVCAIINGTSIRNAHVQRAASTLLLADGPSVRTVSDGRRAGTIGARLAALLALLRRRLLL